MSSNLIDFLVILSIIISPLVLSKLLVRVFKIKDVTALLLSFITLTVPILLIFGLEGALLEAMTLLFLVFLVGGLKLLVWLR